MPPHPRTHTRTAEHERVWRHFQLRNERVVVMSGKLLAVILNYLEEAGLDKTAQVLAEEAQGQLEHVETEELPEMEELWSAYKMVADQDGGVLSTYSKIEGLLEDYQETKRRVQRDIALENLCGNEEFCSKIAATINQTLQPGQLELPNALDPIFNEITNDDATFKALEEALCAFIDDDDEPHLESQFSDSFQTHSELDAKQFDEGPSNKKQKLDYSESRKIMSKASEILKTGEIDLDSFLGSVHKK